MINVNNTNIEIETNVKPITQPARQAVLNALPNECFAENVVRQFENVAIFMPNAPQNMDVMAPVMKAIVVYQVFA